MPIELSYENKEAVPAEFLSLYSEADGKFTLTGISGMKTQQDVTNVQEGLRKEREDHTATRLLLKPWGDLKPDEVHADLDKIKEYKLAAEGKIDDEKIAEMVESRLEQKTGPLSRQINSMTDELSTITIERDGLRTELDTRDRNDVLRVIGTEMKVISTAMPDLEMTAGMMMERNDDGSWITKSGINGVTPGIDMQGFVKEMQKIRPHWWPASEGGGAGGGDGHLNTDKNPWSYEHWNVTEQGKIFNKDGRTAADKLAEAAGTKFGGSRPLPPKK